MRASTAQESRTSRTLLAIFFGAWASAVALAPSPTAKAILAAPAILIPLSIWTIAKPARWIALFFATALLLPPLPIALGDSGPHPSLAFAALGIVAGAAWVRNWRIPLTGPAAALAALFAVLLASVGFAAIYSGPEAAVLSLARVALFGIPVYIFFYAAGAPEQGRPSLRFLYWISAAAALFACIDFYFQLPAPAGYGPQFVWLDSGVFRRAQGLFYEASTLGNFCVFFLVMIAASFARPSAAPVKRRLSLAAGATVFLAALVLSYSRGSVVSLLVALAMLAWFERRSLRVVKTAAILLTLLLVAALVIWRVFPGFAEVYWIRLSASAEFLFSATEGILSGRVATWRALTAWIAANPWQALTGIGYKTLPYTNYLGTPLVADNMYLSILVETGIAGLAALVWLNLSILRASARAARSLDPQRAFCGLWMLCFWAGECVQMASGDLLTYWRVLPVYFWVLALALRA
jgi:O-antigen ligase